MNIVNKQRLNDMNYKELQIALKRYKNQGLTEIRLNATKKELQAEYDRLTSVKYEQQEKEQKDEDLRNELRTWENKEDLLFKRWKQAKDDNAPKTETDYLRSKMDECDDKIHQLCKALKELNKDEIERQAKEEHLLRIRKLVYLGNHEMKNNIPRTDLPVVGIFENNDKGYQNAMKVITNKYPNLEWEWMSDNSVYGGHFATFNNPKCEGDSILII